MQTDRIAREFKPRAKRTVKNFVVTTEFDKRYPPVKHPNEGIDGREL